MTTVIGFVARVIYETKISIESSLHCIRIKRTGVGSELRSARLQSSSSNLLEAKKCYCRENSGLEMHGEDDLRFVLCRGVSRLCSIEDVDDEKKHRGPSIFLYSLMTWLIPFRKDALTV